MDRKSSKIKKIKVLVAVFAVVLSGLVTPVFADSEEILGSYPTQVNSIPDFYIYRIDIENNQLSFAFDPLFTNGKEISEFGAGWISDRSEAVLNRDIRTFSEISGGSVQRVFWSDDWEIEDFYAFDLGFRKIYTVDSEVSLRNNPFKDMFYIVKFTDGDIWMNRVNYGNCGWNWTEGKSCEAGSYTIGKEEDNVYYQLMNAPEKFIRTRFTKKASGVDDSGDGDDPQEPGDLIEPDDEGSDETASRDDVDANGGDSDAVSEVVVAESEEVTPVMAVASTVKYATYSTAGFSGDDEVTEVNEGFGETTLDVPKLGGAEQACKEISPWLYLVAGAAAGSILTWFLLLITRRNSRTNWR